MKSRKILLSSFLLLAIITVALAKHTEIRDTNAGYQIGTGASEKIAFHGATPCIQRTSSSQAAVTTTVGAAVTTTAATQTTPYGFATQAQADALVSRVNQLRADVLAMTTLVNELRASLVEKGLITGS